MSTPWESHELRRLAQSGRRCRSAVAREFENKLWCVSTQVQRPGTVMVTVMAVHRPPADVCNGVISILIILLRVLPTTTV